MTFLFLGFAGVMAAVVIGLSARYLGRRSAIVVASVLMTWLLYVGCISYFGVIRNVAMRPPGPIFLFAPLLVFLAAFIVRTQTAPGRQTATAFPLSLLLGLQTFRVVVELFLHQLWHDGLIPRMLTFSGANLDIYVGASAPVFAWVAMRGCAGRSVVLGWNVLSLLVLANVVVRAILSAPGPLNLIHAEVPDLMIGTFPFTYIPGFFVPLAVVLHVLAIRAINLAKREAVA